MGEIEKEKRNLLFSGEIDFAEFSLADELSDLEVVEAPFFSLHFWARVLALLGLVRIRAGAGFKN